MAQQIFDRGRGEAKLCIWSISIIYAFIIIIILLFKAFNNLNKSEINDRGAL